ncbi:MAG: nucleoside hydrolase [Anaerolineae bacterium]|jgi:inosine-uridine nucleoside N-ribohydrolase|nr:nucleoside hydrolase [Anaerolineae bacterium]
MKAPIPVILDTDIGGDIDDTWALCMLLGCPELDLKMVVTEHGDTHYRAALAAKYLTVAGRDDIPIGVGVEDLTYETDRNQAPWLGDYQLQDYAGEVYEDGVQAMIDLILSSEETITIIAIGIVKNLAKALEIEPRIAEKCKFVGMHGSIYQGYGGSPEISAEANVVNDVPSFRAVMAAPWQDLLITPLDTCGVVILEGDQYQRVYNSSLPRMRAVIENYIPWIKLVKWTNVTEEYTREKSTVLFDCVAVYLAYAEDLCQIEEVHISTDDQGFNHIDPNGAKVRAALAWNDLDAFYDHLVGRLLKA